MFKVWFHPLFIVCIIISIALRKMGNFLFYLLLLLFMNFFIFWSVKISFDMYKMEHYSVGQMASIKNLEFQSPLKQSIILIAGPIINLSMWE